MGRWIRYCNSKLANVLYARELAARYPEILSFSIHPGVVGTGLITDLSLADRAFLWVTNLGKILSVEEGAYNSIWAVTTPRRGVKSGGFYEPVGLLNEKETASSRDPQVQKDLWEWTEKELEKWMR